VRAAGAAGGRGAPAPSAAARRCRGRCARPSQCRHGPEPASRRSGRRRAAAAAAAPRRPASRSRPSGGAGCLPPRQIHQHERARARGHVGPGPGGQGASQRLDRLHHALACRLPRRMLSAGCLRPGVGAGDARVSWPCWLARTSGHLASQKEGLAPDPMFPTRRAAGRACWCAGTGRHLTEPGQQGEVVGMLYAAGPGPGAHSRRAARSGSRAPRSPCRGPSPRSATRCSARSRRSACSCASAGRPARRTPP